MMVVCTSLFLVVVAAPLGLAFAPQHSLGGLTRRGTIARRNGNAALRGKGRAALPMGMILGGSLPHTSAGGKTLGELLEGEIESGATQEGMKFW